MEGKSAHLVCSRGSEFATRKFASVNSARRESNRVDPTFGSYILCVKSSSLFIFQAKIIVDTKIAG